jgi:hypothetical protein
MVQISRYTEASIAPIFIEIETNRARRVLNLPGPISSVEIPGDRIFRLVISEGQLYGIRIVADDIEYRLDEIDRISDIQNVDAIIIFDGFLYARGGLPGYTYRPQYVARGTLVESGKSFVYPGTCIPPVPYGPFPAYPPLFPYNTIPGYYPPPPILTRRDRRILRDDLDDDLI